MKLKVIPKEITIYQVSIEDKYLFNLDLVLDTLERLKNKETEVQIMNRCLRQFLISKGAIQEMRLLGVYEIPNIPICEQLYEEFASVPKE